MDLLIATKNLGKLKEFEELLKDLPVTLHSLKEFPDVLEAEETGETLMENALIKAKYYYELTKMPTLSDDTGLFIDALDGRPGLFTARYSGGTDEDNRRKVLAELKGCKMRHCYFETALSFYNGHDLITATGFLNGEITEKEMGGHGFGYDSIFYVPEYQMTLALMDEEKKNTISHRYLATNAFLLKFKRYLHLITDEELIKDYLPDLFNYSLLKGGMSNDTYLVETPKQKYVLRIPGLSSEIFINRNIERQALLKVSSHEHFLNQLTYFDNGLLITSYIESKDATQNDRLNTLKELHQLSFNIPYSPFKRFLYYERLNKLFNVPFIKEYELLKAKLFQFEETLSKRPLVFCHNDCQLSNFLGATLIDFEFCGLNDYLYDYACFGNNDINLSYQLIEMDEDIINKEEAIIIVDLWYSLQALSWYLVAIFKDAIGFSKSQGLDFQAIGLMFFNKAKALLAKY